MSGKSDERLRSERIESTPKRVILSPNFRDWRGTLSDPTVARRFNEVSDHIANGHIVPPNFYRRGIDRDHDELLDAEGIKHLHLDEGGGNALLFCVEYEDAVVFLEINDHRHFQTEPVGSVLSSLHHNLLKTQDENAEERRGARIRDKMAAARKGLLKRRTSSDSSRDESAPHGTDE